MKPHYKDQGHNKVLPAQVYNTLWATMINTCGEMLEWLTEYRQRVLEENLLYC